MTINFNLHKTLEVLSKIKLPILTLVFAFISSLNLWFLSFYFFNNTFLIHHGLVITMLTTTALTTTWCLIVGISVPKFMILFELKATGDISDDKDSSGSNLIVNLFVFLEIIILHCLFLYLEYIFHWDFKILLSIIFFFSVAQFFLIDAFLKNAYVEYVEKQKQDNQ